VLQNTQYPLVLCIIKVYEVYGGEASPGEKKRFIRAFAIAATIIIIGTVAAIIL
jgi:hypothetical protein